MKLSLTLDEAKAGTKVARYTKTTTDLEFVAKRGEPLVLSRPVAIEGRRFTIAVPKRFDRTADKKYELDFELIWQRTWIVCEARTSKIRLLVLELDGQKISFSPEGCRQCDFTTEGDGVGQDADEAAEGLLPKLLSEDPRRAFVDGASDFLSKLVERVAVAA